jgi:hypothetical protein
VSPGARAVAGGMRLTAGELRELAEASRVTLLFVPRGRGLADELLEVADLVAYEGGRLVAVTAAGEALKARAARPYGAA